MNKLKIVLPILIVALGGMAAALLVNSRDPVETRPAPPTAPLVSVLSVETSDQSLVVTAQGSVLPPTEATLGAQVAGEVVATAETFVAGGFFRRGDVLVRLDRRDYELAIESAKSEVAQVELQLAQERAEARLAADEWAELGSGGEPDPLVVRIPQIARLEAAKRAAEARVKRAELDLERTVVRAPYEGRVRRVDVGRGQFVSPGTPLATIHPTEHAEVRLPVIDQQLAFLDLDLARRYRYGKGPKVTLAANFAGRIERWPATIVRTEGELDPRTRMIHLIARVDDPYSRTPAHAGRAPLPVGLFVDAEIEGRRVEQVFLLPRSAVRLEPRGERYQVLVVEGDDRLRIRPVSVLRLAEDRALLDGGLEDGDRIITSSLEVVVDGMRVRTRQTDRTQTDGPQTDGTEQNEIAPEVDGIEATSEAQG